MHLHHLRRAATVAGLLLAGIVSATPTGKITGVGTRDASGVLQMSNSSVDLGDNRALLITGYMADYVGKDAGTNGRVILLAGSGAQYSIPFVNRLWGAKAALEAAGINKLDTALAAALNNAGFLAAADSYTLPAGTYTVKSIVATFGSGISTVPVTDSFTVTVPAVRTGVALTLTDAMGTPVTMVPKLNTTSGDLRLTGYPAQPSGAYTLSVPVYDKWGQSAGPALQFTLNYLRPVAPVNVFNPQAEGFSGFVQVFSLTNPLTGSALTGTLDGVAAIQNANGSPTTTSALINGTTIAAGASTPISLAPKVTGAGSSASVSYSMRAAVAGGSGKVRMFINAPDAPDLDITVANWNPDTSIAVTSPKSTFAVGVENATINVGRAQGSRCGPIFSATTTQTFGADSVLCAVRWTTPVSGLSLAGNLADLTGTLTDTGAVTGVYETGVLWTDPTTMQAQFFRSGSHTISVNGAPPVPPTIKFVPDQALNKPGMTNNLTYAGTAVAGAVTVSAPYSGLTVTITPDSGAPVTSSSASSAFFRPLTIADSFIGSQRSYLVEAAYSKAPTVKYSANLLFDVIPRSQFLLLLAPQGAVSTANVTINGKFGLPQVGGGFTFDSSTQGSWSIQLKTMDAKGVQPPVSTPVTTIGSDGAVSFDVGLLAAGRATFKAVATQLDAPTSSPLAVTSGAVAAFVHGGDAIAVDGIVKPASGASPFSASVGVWPRNAAQVADIGQIAFQVSDDGTNFSPLLDANGAPVAGLALLFIPQKLTGNSQKYYKATVKNRWSDAIFESGVVSLQSFIQPAVHITGPKATFVGNPVTLTAVPDGGATNLSYTWTVKLGTFDANPTTYTGGTLTLTPSRPMPDLLITLSAKDASAPNNPLATKLAYWGVNVLPPLLARPVVTGPTVVEAGQTYTWTAIQASPFGANSGTDLVIESHWVLPDGSASTDNPVTYTIQPGDQQKIRFQSGVTGFPTTNVFTDLAFTEWTYQWPSLRMLTTVQSPYVPAQVLFNAGLTFPAQITLLHGEPLTYTWSFPVGVTVVSQVNGLATVQFPTAGSFQVSATISDTRGNSTTVTSDTIQVLPPKPLTFNLSLTSSDRWNRPPGPVLARTAPTSLPTGDAVAGVTFFVNGSQVGSEVPSGANLSLPDPGTYSVRAVMRSIKGVTAEATQPITMTTGDNPVCVLRKNGNGTTVLWFQSLCTVQRGVVVRYSYFVNDEPSQVTANTISFPLASIPGTNTVKVIATTDKGQQGAAIFDVSSGSSSPTTP